MHNGYGELAHFFFWHHHHFRNPLYIYISGRSVFLHQVKSTEGWLYVLSHNYICFKARFRNHIADTYFDAAAYQQLSTVNWVDSDSLLD